MPLLQFPSDRIVGTLEWAGSYSDERGPVLATGNVAAPDDLELRLDVQTIRDAWREGRSWSLLPATDPVDLRFLTGLPPTAVDSLSIRTADESTFDAVAHLAPGLRRLALPWSGFSDAVLPVVAQLTELVFLQTFGNPFSDAGVQQLASLTKLESLYLEEETLSVAAFAFADRLPALERLGLQDVRVSPDDVDGLRRRLPGVRVE